MLDLVKELCSLDGTSGREEKVREYIIKKIEGKCEYKVDPMGNILAFKKGKETPKNKVMLSAHMDEVGFIVTYITDDGYIKFATVGGIDSKVIAGRTVRFSQSKEKVCGVIGLKAVHLTDSSDKSKVPSVSQMYIDIGASSKEEAEKYVSVGDSAYFVSESVEFGTSKLKAKAIDDRFGCAIMLSMIESDLPYDAHFAFLVQEEVGLRGAGPAAYTVAPDYAIVLEATTAADVAGVGDADTVCKQGEGAVISFMDRSTVYNLDMFKGAFETAKKKNIKCQPKTAVAGGNDAGAIHKSIGGIKTITISLPCRYIHSGTSVADVRDMDSCKALAVALFEEYANA